MNDEKNRRFQILGLSGDQLKQVRVLTKYSGPDGLPFFEQAVWWWRPLLGIIGHRGHCISIPAKKSRGFFPRSVFLEMRASESGGGLHDILAFWFREELAARLSDAESLWPAYTVDTSNAREPSWDSLHEAYIPARIVDLRKTDAELVLEFKRSLNECRETRRDRASFPVNDRVTKSSYLSHHTFALIELIDRRKCSVGKQVEDAEWANVNKAVRQHAPYILKRSEYFLPKE